MEFYGPVEVWVHKEDGEWVAWADPFSEFGTGQTEEEAVKAAQKSVGDYLLLVAAEMRAGKNVRLLAPLTPEEQIGKRYCFDLVAVAILKPVVDAAPVAAQEPVSTQRRGEARELPVLQPLSDIVDALRKHLAIHLTPCHLCAA